MERTCNSDSPTNKKMCPSIYHPHGEHAGKRVLYVSVIHKKATKNLLFFVTFGWCFCLFLAACLCFAYLFWESVLSGGGFIHCLSWAYIHTNSKPANETNRKKKQKKKSRKIDDMDYRFILLYESRCLCARGSAECVWHFFSFKFVSLLRGV